MRHPTPNNTMFKDLRPGTLFIINPQHLTARDGQPLGSLENPSVVLTVLDKPGPAPDYNNVSKPDGSLDHIVANCRVIVLKTRP